MEQIEAVGTLLGALFAGWAAWQARRAARSLEAQSKQNELFQRELSVDAHWMRYQEYYEKCIELFSAHPGMPLASYQALDGIQQRKLNLAAIALLQAVDQAYRAEDRRAEVLASYLNYHAGPLCTDDAIHNGGILSSRTIGLGTEFACGRAFSPYS
jgi:hypothetical protein